jgi:tRNA 2-selenouridine synthase
MEPIRQDAERFLTAKAGIALADVRTPLEYSKGHIPGAKLFPLFSNEERSEVGKLYALYGNERAVEKGYEIAGQKLKYYLSEALHIAPDKTLSIYCWRGGMRSASIAWLLGFSGFRISVLDGGYKAYRKHCAVQFAKQAKIILLGGYTGAGKTEILQCLEKKGEQVIKLEELASHKGSAFGAIGEKPQPSQEQFENNLADYWQKLDLNRWVWIEDESINIGSIQIPKPLFSQMQKAPILVLETERTIRIERLVKDYQRGATEDLVKAFNLINKRIGPKNHNEAIEAVERNDLKIAAGIALNYYDKAYEAHLKLRDLNRLDYVRYEHDPERVSLNLLNKLRILNNNARLLWKRND